MDGRRGRRQYTVGAEVAADGGVDFRVWAPRAMRVDVVIESADGLRTHRLTTDDNGYFCGHVAEAQHGSRYRFRLDEKGEWPDPASRFQPEGPAGPSEVVDPSRFVWSDETWAGVDVAKPQVIYEMHVGTFTKPGTWLAAIEHLPALKDLGVTVLEILPIAEFPGRFGWGYDGVCLFAPSQLYGSPDDVRRFVDAAHVTGLGVILDVVYNHFGPKNNSTGEFSSFYLSDEHVGEWGASLNFDGAHNGPVREFFVANARQWIEEYHFDGLRFDATQAVFDNSPEHILSEITRRIRDENPGRSLYFTGENEPQHARLAKPAVQGGYGIDALWNEDFHHVAMIAATGRREGYYEDYQGKAQEFLSMARRGFLFQGQVNTRQGKPRGTPTAGLRPENFILYMQNHDQVANTLRGTRIHDQTSPSRLRALTAWWLLAPGTPMLFQGQEFAASTPFLYFCDYDAPLCDEVCQGRHKFLSQFASLDNDESRDAIPAPCLPANFERCKLNHGERERNAEIVALHRDLLTMRRKDPVFRNRNPEMSDGVVLGDRAFAFREFGGVNGDRLILVSLGDDLSFVQSPDPLLAPREGEAWALLWSSESVCYGGGGTPTVQPDRAFRLPGSATVVFASEVARESTDE